MKLADDMKAELAELASQPGNSGQTTALVYPLAQGTYTAGYKLFRDKAAAYEKREEFWDDGIPMDDMLIVDLWNLQEESCARQLTGS